MVFGILFIAAMGITITQYIAYEIEKNSAHNKDVLQRITQVEVEAALISSRFLPAFKALHTLDVAATRHVSEFELYVLDFDRDQDLLVASLSMLETAFEMFPENLQNIAAIEQKELEEIVGVFTDITHEALEVRSPNKLFQLLEDSEDVFSEFRAQLDHFRKAMDHAVSELSKVIIQDLHNSREKVSLQQTMLQRLENISRWGLSFLILSVLLVTILLFHNLQHRLNIVAKYAHSIADGQYTSTIDFTSSDKIGDMAESVGHMGGSMAALVKELGHKAESAHRSARETKRLAYYDSLTGLPNRQHFIEKLESSIEKARKTEEMFAVAYLDLDGFKKVNDSYGHSMGDQLLCAVADRLMHNVRDDDAISRSVNDPPVLLPSRLGGDEFTFLIKQIHDRGEAEIITRRILHALDKPYQLDKRELSITPSIGVAVFPGDGMTVSELLKNSDMAMYQAKESGRNNIKLFNAKISNQQVRMIGLERDLTKALEREELNVHYQAKIDLNSSQIVGAEALLRWQHPQRGMVSPVEFIPLAEDSGMIVPIGNWVLQQACNQIVQWQSKNITPVPIAVNVSAKQFTRSDMVSVVSDCIEAAGIGPEYIELELTESSLMKDTVLMVDNLSELQKIGIMTNLDDFGTGYSSLSYLKRFPLNTLKIDRSFVQDIETNVEDAAIVKAILAMSNSLGLKVIAEGVETESQASFLRKHGCQEAQGYLYSKPLPAHAFTDFLMQGTTASAAQSGKSQSC